MSGNFGLMAPAHWNACPGRHENLDRCFCDYGRSAWPF